MLRRVATIVVPTFQHALYLPDAVKSALAQTVPCEVIVVDDGSTDNTQAVLKPYESFIRTIATPHRGVAQARNIGIELATTDFVMFLDADDTIEPSKIALQLAQFACDPYIGWSLCDVRIEREGGRVYNASDDYRYSEIVFGWVGKRLAEANFIPVMSPLVKRSILGETIRFIDQKVEDWRFWQDVAQVAPCAYVPQVLATYRRRTTGRHNA